MSEPEAAPEPQAEAPAVPAKRREMRKISDIIIDIPYGEQVNGASYITEPSDMEISHAVASKTLEERINHGDSKDALYAEFGAKAAGNLGNYLRFVREYHARRVAYFVVHGWDDFIGLNAQGALRDGGHRFRAARFMGKDEVEVELG